MKKTITLTKMLTLALMLVTFTTATASFDGEGKCKTKCCKEQKQKELTVAIAALEKAMSILEAELKAVAATAVTPKMKRSFTKMRTIKTPAQMFAFAASFEVAEETEADAKFRINFADLDKEMDAAQEKMTVAPASGQKIDFCNLEKEMDDMQKQMSRMDNING